MADSVGLKRGLRRFLAYVWDWEIAKPYFAIAAVGIVAMACVVAFDLLVKLWGLSR